MVTHNEKDPTKRRQHAFLVLASAILVPSILMSLGLAGCGQSSEELEAVDYTPLPGDGWKVSPKEFIEAGERVVVTGKYSGTCKATGKSFEADFAHIWTIHDGKAANFVQYADTALVQEAFRK